MTDKKQSNPDLIERHVHLRAERVELADDRPTRPSIPNAIRAPVPRPQRSVSTDAMRKVSESEAKIDGTVAGIGAHMVHVGEKLTELVDAKNAEERRRANDKEVEDARRQAQDDRDRETRQVLALVAREVGLEDRLPPTMKTSIPPPPNGKQRAPLARRIDRQRIAELVAAATAALWAIEHVAKLIAKALGD